MASLQGYVDRTRSLSITITPLHTILSYPLKRSRSPRPSRWTRYRRASFLPQRTFLNTRLTLLVLRLLCTR